MSDIFLSYASEQSDAARHIELSLEGEGHRVFRDRTSLPTGEAFNARIRAAIEEADLFVFLISPQSVSPGRYTLTELTFAEQVWAHPAGHVLPVMVAPVPKEAVPAFLRAVTILNPRGNLAAEVAAEIARMTAPWWRRMLGPRRLVPTAAVVVMVGVVVGLWLPDYLERREQERQVIALERESQLKVESGDYSEALKLLDRAETVAPGAASVVQAKERLAMQSLREAGFNSYRGSGSAFADLVTQTLPVLSGGASEATGERLANLQAHMGWADYLRERAGVGGLEPAQHYRRALDTDPENIYAHAMWGFEILRRRGSAPAIVEAKRHFEAALASRRELPYLRSLQVSALLQSYTNVWIDDQEREAAALSVVNEMRLDNEARPTGWTAPGALKRKIWPIYHFAVATGEHPMPVLAALPGEQHLATFLWLFPEDDLPADSGAPSLFTYLFVIAHLQEQADERDQALASYRRLLNEFANKRYNDRASTTIAGIATAAVTRLSS